MMTDKPDSRNSRGQQAEWKWHISLTDAQRPAINDKDRADFKRLRGFEIVQKGQELVSMADPGDTKSLYPDDAYGKHPLPAGENTTISEDGKTLIAAIDGVASWYNDAVHVEEVYHIRGNVDYHTGNIKYKGPVVIDGDVRSGFRVESNESIYISGSVGASHIYTQNGDITVACGILGKGRAKILAGGNLKCGFIQDATAGVRQDIIIDRYSINSSLSAGGRVILAKYEGLIRGGSVTAESGIVARDVGSSRNLYTELKLRSQGEQSSQKTIWEISKKRADLMLRKSSLSNRHSFLSVLKKGVDQLSDSKMQEFDKVTDELVRLDEKLQELDKKEIDLQKRLSRESLNREIKVINQLFRNVRIDIGGKEYFTDSPLQNVKIFRFKDDIVIESLADVEDQDYDIFIPST